MFNPHHVDGRTLVILRRVQFGFGSPFSVVTSGRLEHDGETLTLVGNEMRRVVTAQELAGFKNVKPDTQIAVCRSFDLFLIRD